MLTLTPPVQQFKCQSDNLNSSSTFDFNNAVTEQWCPGYPTQYSCSATDRLVWSGTVFTGQCLEEQITVVDNTTVVCGQITATNIIAPDPNFPGLTLIRSTLTFIAKVDMAGASLFCITPLMLGVDTTLSIRSKFQASRRGYCTMSYIIIL